MANSGAAPHIEIEYCTRCGFLLRAAWIAQELLRAFETEIGEVALKPAVAGTLSFVSTVSCFFRVASRDVSRRQRSSSSCSEMPSGPTSVSGTTGLTAVPTGRQTEGACGSISGW